MVRIAKPFKVILIFAVITTQFAFVYTVLRSMLSNQQVGEALEPLINLEAIELSETGKPDQKSGFNQRETVSIIRSKKRSLSKETDDNVVEVHECPKHPPHLLGQLVPRQVDVPDMEPGSAEFDDWFSPDLGPGGTWHPDECTARQKVAIIVPFRNRAHDLRIFLHHLHPILQRQQLDYRIMIVEQSSEEDFNRAALLNIGYVEASKLDNYDCLIFHDIDLLSEDDRNLYRCPTGNRAKHLSVAIDKMKYRLLYKRLFGGVTAMSTQIFRSINGFANGFYGWGGEDDDLQHRINKRNITIVRSQANIAKYAMIKHEYVEMNENLKDMMRKSKYDELAEDGLTKLKYELLKREERALYTWVLVKLPPGPEKKRAPSGGKRKKHESQPVWDNPFIPYNISGFFHALSGDKNETEEVKKIKGDRVY